MNILVTAVAVCVLVIGIFFSQKDKLEKDPQSEVLSQKAPGEDEIEESTPTASVAPSPIDVKGFSQPVSLNEYYYPSSSVVSSSAMKLLLESTDDTDSITNWYKEKIVKLGLNVKTFVATSANEHVLNKLVGVGSDLEVRVDIEKKSKDSKIKIEISLENR